MKATTVLIIGFGGFIDTILLYLTSVFFTKNFDTSNIPFGTFAVNIVGCFVIGIVYGLTERFQVLSPQWRLFLTTGIFGGFTTFSAFAYENIAMLQQANHMNFALYSISTFVLCLAAVYAGLSIIKIF